MTSLKLFKLFKLLMPSDAFNFPLITEIPYQEPVKLFAPFAIQEGSIFLDSALKSHGLARYSFIAVEPWAIFRAKNQQLSFQECIWEGNPFVELQKLMQSFPLIAHEGLPPFQGGIVGFFGYGLAHSLEQLPRPARDDRDFPDLMVGFYDTIVAFDHHDKKAWIFASGYPETEPRSRKQRAIVRTQALQQKLLTTPELLPAAATPITAIHSDFTPKDYEHAIQCVIDYIYAGDIFQANMTRRFCASLPEHVSAFDLYRRLRVMTPAPFAAYVQFAGVTLACASPERFLQLSQGKIETRPIKGTRPRGSTPQQDQTFATELRQSPKDCAENIMIVDLLRNDLSRVCVPHSVQTPELLRVETYATLHHLVSTVTGQLQQPHTALDLLQATFPGGSITGAPKIRAMEIIAELEPTARGPYCGSIGYIGFDGTMDTNIVIRTYTIKERDITFQTGGGIVADSDPYQEYLETETKALALKRALLNDPHYR
jgi:para-aminobenzoate synthetase component 1